MSGGRAVIPVWKTIDQEPSWITAVVRAPGCDDVFVRLSDTPEIDKPVWRRRLADGGWSDEYCRWSDIVGQCDNDLVRVSSWEWAPDTDGTIECSEPGCTEHIPAGVRDDDAVAEWEDAGGIVVVENNQVIVFCYDHVPLTWCSESGDRTHLWQADPDAPYGVMCGWCDQEVLPPGTDPRTLVKENDEPDTQAG